MRQEMTERITELRGDNTLLEPLRVSIQSNLTAIVQVLSYRIEPTRWRLRWARGRMPVAC